MKHIIVMGVSSRSTDQETMSLLLIDLFNFIKNIL